MVGPGVSRCSRDHRAAGLLDSVAVGVSGAQFADLLERHRIDFSAGVPCSLIEDLIATLETHPRIPYVPAVREDVAVGLAAGAWLAGRRPAVLMQNSGLGTSLNALASLSLMYGLPALLLVTWRGYQGNDAPEHILMGEISPKLLTLCGIPHRVLAAESLEADLAWAVAEMEQRLQPVALLVPPGVVEMGRVHARAADRPASLDESAAPSLPAALPEPTISRLAALGAALKPLGREPLVHANGYICRESFSLGDRSKNFYMIGSMGLASAIGLGLVLARPRGHAVVFDGDGNLLMNLGILAQVGARRSSSIACSTTRSTARRATRRPPRTRCGSIVSPPPPAIAPPSPSPQPARSRLPCGPRSEAKVRTSCSSWSPAKRPRRRASRSRPRRSATDSARVFSRVEALRYLQAARRDHALE